LNRFYTLEFFREAARKLSGSGVLALRLSASEDYISPELAAFLRSIYKTLRAVFPESRRFRAKTFSSSAPSDRGPGGRLRGAAGAAAGAAA